MRIEQIKEVVDYGIIGLLVLMSIIVVAFAIERWLFFRSVDPLSYKSKIALELDLMKRLPTIATIGSNAPYIGLLGTVLAIILTFYIIGQKGGDVEAGEVMKHLALALKATAAGLVVAIPATMLYNMLLSHIDRILAHWELFKEEGE